jgi:hypothetical protein
VFLAEPRRAAFCGIAENTDQAKTALNRCSVDIYAFLKKTVENAKK